MRGVVSLNRGDWALVVAVAVMLIFGIIMLGSASSALAFRKFNDSFYFIRGQGIYILIGIVAFWIFARIDYHRWRSWSFYLWCFAIALLLLVFMPKIGLEKNEARSWINLGIISFQPVEFVKLFLILFLSASLSDKRREDIEDFGKGIIPFAVIAGLPLFLILIQPDFGSMMLVFGIAFIIFFASGASIRHLGLIIFALAIVGTIFIYTGSEYRLERLTSFLNPERDISAVGYQLQQALIAIGSGGFFGKGFGESVQKYQYLPEAAGDSIFAVIVEELGIVTGIILLGLFAFILVRTLRIAARSPDIYGKLVATGIASWVAFQAFLNIGSIVGLLPITGIPLPFISQGGTSIVALLAAIGILFNISKQILPRY